MSVRSSIASLFEEVAREQQRRLPPLTNELKLLQSGLDSLSFALIVARLEETLGVDPFDVTVSHQENVRHRESGRSSAERSAL